MSEQTKSEQPQVVTEEAPHVESAPLTDADLEDISGGGSGGSAVVQKNGTGYSAARP